MAIDGIGSGGTPTYKPQVTEAKPAQKAAEPAKVEGASTSISQKLGEGFDAVKKKLMSISGRFSAPAAPAAANTQLAQDISMQRAASNAGYTLMPTMNAQAEREMPALDNKPVSLNTPEGRKQLVSNTSQVNEVSKKAGNDQVICGGASVANALVLSSDTPEKAKANSDALRASASKLTSLTPAEDTALKNMSKGQMSTTDMAHLQQLSQKLVKSSNQGEPLANPGEMATAVTLLKANGGFPGPAPQTVEFHNTRLPPPGEANHWTVSVDNQHANSLTSKGYKGASVTDGAPPDTKMAASNEKWRGGVMLQNYNNPPTIDLSYRAKNRDGSDEAGQMHQTTIENPGQYKMGSMSDFGPLDRLTEKVASSKDNKVRMGEPD